MNRRRWTRREFLEQAARHTAGAGLAGMVLPALACSVRSATAPYREVL